MTRESGSTICIGDDILQTECGHSFVTCHTGRCFIKPEMLTWTVVDSGGWWHTVEAHAIRHGAEGFITFWNKAEGPLDEMVATFYQPQAVLKKKEKEDDA